MEASYTAAESWWTTGKLFWVSLLSIPAFAGVALVCFAFWWPLAFDWDADATPPPLAWVVLGAGLLSLLGSVLAAGATVFHGVAFLHGKFFGS